MLSAGMSTNIFLINLDRDAARYEHMASQLHAVGLPFERVPGILGNALPNWLRPYFLKPDGTAASDLTAGEIGCYASHLLLMRRVAEMDAPAIVLEDDLMLQPDFAEALQHCARLPRDLDLLKLCSGTTRATLPITSLPSGRRVVKYARVPTCTGAHMITPQGARKFLAWRQPRTFAIDQDLRRPWDCRMRVYGVEPAPIIANVLQSSIATFGALPMGRRFVVGNPIVDRGRRFVHDLAWLGVRGWIQMKLAEPEADGR